MKRTLLSASLILTALGSTAAAQSNGTVRVAPGQFCALNKCVRFSQDLQTVQIQARQPVSVAALDLDSDPVITTEQFRQIFNLALSQRGVNGSR